MTWVGLMAMELLINQSLILFYTFMTKSRECVTLGADEMAWWVEMLSVTCDHLHVISGIHRVERIEFCKLSSDLLHDVMEVCHSLQK